ncbi:MAG: CoA pyrophosphatase [Chloroflexi bacterium]|nr:CoA pyrophosphatase [Chloroflexota bacterium]MBP8056167.1 CoA pyrophosphatase [Chloroflexota bacterium]
MNASLELIQQALNLTDFDPVTHQRQMAPVPRPIRRPENLSGRPRIGAVLLLLYPKQDQLHLVLTRRRDDLNSHAGQISFPGGRQDEGESLTQTALREAHEEVGVDAAQIHVLGELTPIYIPPSDFEVHPFVGWLAAAPTFYPAEWEVAEIVEVPLSHLLNPTTKRQEPRDFNGLTLQIPYYAVGEHKVWGATAIMLSEFMGRMEEVGYPRSC